MSIDTLADAVGVLAILAGSILCLTSSIGLLRLPDLYSRMHAGAKPQALGLLLVLLGIGLRLRSGLDVGMLVLVGIFQMLTIPVSAHLVARARYRDDHPR
ncbi:multicomponent Na+:H+ antiporter subunit G [Kineosphaera limosa]|uniref:Na(+)/H(+) antiporter subunit G n=1 Tax=Kineosphaera limosa NBRC 100340 TaxID=1184609 RepID=K6WRX2_9MICO|nr:monovalent cation/H(+) antiporter subunit G [Kineosphaera limosa]NYD98863.1 multicomponent Na+:H+ antiporter subunit G [Kineosphaera limosa]GAB94812.1 Na(+)/H(+) antiporter subunit G [Kineosphaera limosa NBRC 100340]